MNRRELLIGSGALPFAASAIQHLQSDAKRVAFVIGEFTNVIDVGGPWEVFQDVMGPAGHSPMFELFTVGLDRRPTKMTGGFTVVPDYDFRSAPKADVIVVPAQRGSPQMLAWLRQESRRAQVTMSVCTGAFQLARAGLLDGLAATTHHESWDSLAKEFPLVKVQRGPRWVDAGRIVTAGGLTSGIDAALHVVSRLCGTESARRTATFMEHRSEEWQSPSQLGASGIECRA